MTFPESLERLSDELKGLSHRQCLAFAASCCERSLPNYFIFSRAERWGDPDCLGGMLDNVWDYLREGRPSVEVLLSKKDRCLELAPDSENFPANSELAAAAQEAVFMVTVLLEFCAYPDNRHAIRIAGFARDTIDRRVHLKEGLECIAPDFESRIASDPLMNAEMRKQQEDLEELRASQLTPEFLLLFRTRTLTIGTSNIGYADER
jgi:uncharacterized protein YjaG (DUF416 family)